MMDIKKKKDIIVIGGGMSGCSTAYYLAKSGFNVVIVEQRSIGSGASGRTGSCLMQLDGRNMTPERVRKRLPFVRADVKLLHGLKYELEQDIELLSFGGIDIANSEEEADLLRGVVEIQKTGGDDETEFVDKVTLKEISPAISEKNYGAKYCKTDGTFNPIKLCWSYVFTAHNRYNLHLALHKKVEKVIFKGGIAIGVKTNQEEMFAEVGVINCTNAWSPYLIQEIPIFPVSGVTAVTERIPYIPVTSWESTYKGHYCYGTSQESGNLIIGGLPTYMPDTVDGHFKESASYEELERFAGMLSMLYPSLSKISFLRIWSGVMGMTPDRLPYIGKIPGYDNYYINTGYSNGLAYCPIGGKLIAEYISRKGNTSISLDLVRPERFFGMKFDLPKQYNYELLDKIIGEWNL